MHRSPLIAASFVALVLALAAAPQAGASVRCLGAASRDAEHPCFNPHLLTAVSPRPFAALLETDDPCAPFDRAWPISVCWFGVSAAPGPHAIAVIWVRHASHWRQSVDVCTRDV